MVFGNHVVSEISSLSILAFTDTVFIFFHDFILKNKSFFLQIATFGLYLVLKLKTEDGHGFLSGLWFVKILSFIVCAMLLLFL